MGLISEIFKNSGANNYHLISLDLGTEVVKVLVFYVDSKEKKVVITGIGKESHRAGNVHGSAILNKNGVISTCKKAIGKAKKMAGINLESKKRMRAIIGVSGELAKITAETFCYERKNHQVKINQFELKDLIKKANRKISNRIECKTGRKNSDKKSGVKFINLDVSEISIDGYKVANPLGFKGKKIEVNARGTYMLANNFDLIKSISDSLNLNLINIVYNPRAVIRSIVGESEIESSAIFIDIGGNITDVALAKNKNVEIIKMFVLGGKIFAKGMPSGNDFKFNKDKNRKNGQRFNYNLWLSGVELSLKEFSKNKLLPSKIFVCGGGSQFPEIAGILSKLLSTKYLPFAGKPEIKFIHPKDIARAVDQTEKLVNPQDVTPISIAVSVLDSMSLNI